MRVGLVEAEQAGADAVLEDERRAGRRPRRRESMFMTIAFTGMTIERKTMSSSTKLSESTKRDDDGQVAVHRVDVVDGVGGVAADEDFDAGAVEGGGDVVVAEALHGVAGVLGGGVAVDEDGDDAGVTRRVDLERRSCSPKSGSEATRAREGREGILAPAAELTSPLMTTSRRGEAAGREVAVEHVEAPART